MDQPAARILVMAKAPVAGAAKTRLEPLLGPDGCARLQAALVRHMVAVATGLAPTSVAVAGAAELVAPLVGDVPTFAQCAGDLGARMMAAVDHVRTHVRAPEPPASRGPVARASGSRGARVGVWSRTSRGVPATVSGPECAQIGIDGGVAVVVIGTDCPQLDGGHVDAALALLAAGDDVVFGPARDGGYYLVALASGTPAVTVFDLPPTAWGGPEVLALSRGAAERAGLRVGTIVVEYDLDTPADAALAVADPRVPPEIAALLRDPWAAR